MLSPTSELLQLGTADTLSRTTLCCRGRPVHYTIFRRILDLYPRGPPTHPNSDYQKCPQTLPNAIGGQNLLFLRMTALHYSAFVRWWHNEMHFSWDGIQMLCRAGKRLPLSHRVGTYWLQYLLTFTLCFSSENFQLGNIAARIKTTFPSLSYNQV